jgi:hypothetical protein
MPSPGRNSVTDGRALFTPGSIGLRIIGMIMEADGMIWISPSAC